jgi:uncharacterized protein YjiS (DUF1127 family)
MPSQTTLGPVRAATRRPRRGGARHAKPSTAFRRIIGLLRLWRERMRSRRQLRNLCELDDHVLQDIGWDRAALRFEAEKPFWR